MNAKKLTIAGLALAGVLAAASVEARGRDDVRFSLTIGSPLPFAVHPAPVYGPMFVGGPHHRFHGHPGYQRPTRWDRDGDGVPNRYDRRYNPRWDRDGDGVPNRYDHRDNSRHGRDWRGGRGW